MGDMDGNGVADIAVGAPKDEEGTRTPDLNSGFIFILFLNPDHTVLRHARIGTAMNEEDTVGGLANPMGPGDCFGFSMSKLGDLDGDGILDLIVGAPGDDDGESDRGALYVLFLLASGRVKTQHKISSTEALLGSSRGEWFGAEVGVVGGVERGKSGGEGGVGVVARSTTYVYLLGLNLDGTVKAVRQLTAVKLQRGGIAGVGDVDGNGVVDIVVGEPRKSNVRDEEPGAVYVLLMEGGHQDGGGRQGGGVLLEQKISSNEGGLVTRLSRGDLFGWSVAGLGDLDGDGIPDLAVGAPVHEDVVVSNGGAVYILLLRSDGTVKGSNVISNTQGGLIGPRTEGDQFGSAVARGDSEEGVVRLVVGARKDRAWVEEGGAVYILSLPPSFVEVCPGPNEKCINIGDDGYTCG